MASSVQKARRGLRIYLVTVAVITLLRAVPDRILALLLPGDTFLLVRSLRHFYASAPFLVWFPRWLPLLLGKYKTRDSTMFPSNCAGNGQAAPC